MARTESGNPQNRTVLWCTEPISHTQTLDGWCWWNKKPCPCTRGTCKVEFRAKAVTEMVACCSRTALFLARRQPGGGESRIYNLLVFSLVAPTTCNSFLLFAVWFLLDDPLFGSGDRELRAGDRVIARIHGAGSLSHRRFERRVCTHAGDFDAWTRRVPVRRGIVCAPYVLFVRSFSPLYYFITLFYKCSCILDIFRYVCRRFRRLDKIRNVRRLRNNHRLCNISVIRASFQLLSINILLYFINFGPCATYVLFVRSFQIFY